jgi:hypothetical protein
MAFGLRAILSQMKNFVGQPDSVGWSDRDVDAFDKPIEGDGILLQVGYADGDLRWQNDALRRTISRFASTALGDIRNSFQRASQAALGFNSEQVLMNSRFYVTVGVPFAPPSGMSLTVALEQLIQRLCKASDDIATRTGLRVRLAIGAASGSLYFAKYDMSGINVMGQPYKDAQQLMYWAEDAPWGSAAHKVAIDSRTLNLLNPESQADYRKSTAPKSGHLEDFTDEVHIREITFLDTTSKS